MVVCPQEAGVRSLTCCGTWMLVSCSGDTWPGLACTLAWTNSRCGGKKGAELELLTRMGGWRWLLPYLDRTGKQMFMARRWGEPPPPLPVKVTSYLLGALHLLYNLGGDTGLACRGAGAGL